MGKTIRSFFSAPAFEQSEQSDQARLLNAILCSLLGCTVVTLIVILLVQAYRTALLVGVFFLILTGLKLALNAKKLDFSLWGYFVSMTALNFLFSTMVPEWPILAISLAFIGVTALLLKDISTALVLFILNILGWLLISLPMWRTNPTDILNSVWIAVSALLLIFGVQYFSGIAKNRSSELMQLIDRLEKENQTLRDELFKTHQQLMKEIDSRKLLELKIKDKLEADVTHRYNPQTGALVEAAIKSQITSEISRTQRYQRPLSLLCVRVDNFQPLLSQAGMTPGNLLSILSDAFINSLRHEDLIGHYGDDGFYILLPETGRYASYVVAERLRHLVEVMSLFNANDAVPLTVSIGLTAYQDQSKLTVDVFANQAIQALEEAEAHGGNWTINWYDLNHSI